MQYKADIPHPNLVNGNRRTLLCICVLTLTKQSTIMMATQPPRLFTMRNLGGFLLPNFQNNT